MMGSNTRSINPTESKVIATTTLNEKINLRSISPFNDESKEEAFSIKKDILEAEETQPEYPEGGLAAWLVVIGSFFGIFAAFGLMNSIGLFQAYISTHQLAHYSDSTIGWIFSTYVFLALGCSLPIGPIFDAKGPRILVLLGGICTIAGFFLLGVCKGTWR